MNLSKLKLDARNRALRTGLVGLATDIAATVTLVLIEVFDTPGTDVDWRLLPALLAKTALTSLGSYLLRRYGDPSGMWTPLPPAPQPAPAEPIDESIESGLGDLR